jgi:hypothetical protein
MLKNPGDWPPGGALAGVVSPAGVKGIVSLSPTTLMLDSGLSSTDTPFLLLYGTADGDVNGATDPEVRPFRHYDRATSDRYAIVIEGANHNYFSTSWPTSDASEVLTGSLFAAVRKPLVPPVGADLIAGGDQRDVAKAYVAAFLALLAKDDKGARAYFVEQPAQTRPMGVGQALKLHSQSRRHVNVLKFVLDDFETNGSVSGSSSGQSVSTTTTAVSEGLLLDGFLGNENEPFNRFFQQTQGVAFSWSAAAEYVQGLDPSEGDLRGAQWLGFRIAQQPMHPNTVGLGGWMTIRVEMEDRDGHTGGMSVGALDTIPGVYRSTVGGTDTTSAVFKTFRIPIGALTTDGNELDLEHITKVCLRFGSPGESPQGRVAVDDLEIEK